MVNHTTMNILDPYIDTPGKANYFHYIQQAYKPHDEVPTKEELLARNPQYLDKLRKERAEAAKGMVKYFINGRRPRKVTAK